jgi:hypothetical protein
MDALISDEEKEAIIARAAEKMREWERSIVLELDITRAVGLIGQLQLAFRHPQNTGPTRVELENTVRELIEKMDPSHGDLYQFLLLGFDERHDE